MPTRNPTEEIIIQNPRELEKLRGMSTMDVLGDEAKNILSRSWDKFKQDLTRKRDMSDMMGYTMDTLPPELRQKALDIAMTAGGVSGGVTLKTPDRLFSIIRSLQQPNSPRQTISISELRDKANMSSGEFDSAMLTLAREGKVALMAHDFPSSLPEAKRNKLLKVKDPTGDRGFMYYIGVAPK